MTEQEIANMLFAGQPESSATSQSLLSGVAVSDSARGTVQVKIDGAQVGTGDQESVLLDTTCAVSAGQRVTITLFGRDGSGKKAFVSGVVGGGSGGGDISALEQRMTNAENDIDALETKESDDRTKINELIDAVNATKWYRIYYFTVSGKNHACGLWYQPSSGLVYIGMEVNGQWNTGWNYYNSTALPADLRPSSPPYQPALHDARNVIWSTPRILLCSGADGKLSVNLESGGTSNEAGTLLYMVKPNLSYTSIYYTGPDIVKLSMTRALAARVALGDGLDWTPEELERDVDTLNEAYDIIFGDDTSTQGDER